MTSMTKIEKIEKSKHKQERILVYLEGGDLLRLTEQELLRFGLYVGMDLEDSFVVQLREAGKTSSAKATAARMVGSRALSRRELERKLQRKGVEEEDARQAADWLQDIGALDDEAYAALLVRHYSRQCYGPAWIRAQLQQRGVPRELWQEALEQAPPAEELIEAYIHKKLQGRAPDEKELKRLTDALQRRGFSWSAIRPCLQGLSDSFGWEDEV